MTDKEITAEYDTIYTSKVEAAALAAAIPHPVFSSENILQTVQPLPTTRDAEERHSTAAAAAESLRSTPGAYALGPFEGTVLPPRSFWEQVRVPGSFDTTIASSNSSSNSRTPNTSGTPSRNSSSSELVGGGGGGGATNLRRSTVELLVHAQEVVNDDDEEVGRLAHARPVLAVPKIRRIEAPDGRYSQNCNLTVVFWIVLVLAAGVIVLVVVCRTNVYTGTDDDRTAVPIPISNPVIITAESYLTNMLQDSTLPKTQPNNTNPAESSPPSSQSRAFDWLASDPNLQTYSAPRLLQRYALASFYYATRGPTWIKNRHWLSYEHHECDWIVSDRFIVFGPPIQMADYDDENSPCTADGVYQRLWLGRNNLNGSIPEDLYHGLPSLESIDFFANPLLGGTISSSIQYLTDLTMLSMVSTSNTGTLPSEFGKLSLLEILYLSKDNDEISDRDQSFTGGLPSELGQLSNLAELTVFGNQITSTMPTELGLLTNLKLLGLLGNSITGTIPSELGLAANLRLLFLYDNLITGKLPTTLGQITNLAYIHLYRNSISGTIPTELQVLTGMREFVVSDNAFTGAFSLLDSDSLPELNLLYLSHNPELTGTIALEQLLYNLTKLVALDINETAIRFTSTSMDNTMDTNSSSNGTLSLPDSLQYLLNCSHWSFYHEDIECRAFQQR